MKYFAIVLNILGVTMIATRVWVENPFRTPALIFIIIAGIIFAAGGMKEQHKKVSYVISSLCLLLGIFNILYFFIRDLAELTLLEFIASLFEVTIELFVEFYYLVIFGVITAFIVHYVLRMNRQNN